MTLDPPATFWTLMYTHALKTVLTRVLQRLDNEDDFVSPRELSDLLLRELCQGARHFMEHEGNFWVYFYRNADPAPDDPIPHAHTGELRLFMTFATQSPGDILTWINEAFPDDPCPAFRLHPDGPVQQSRGGPPSPGDLRILQ